MPEPYTPTPEEARYIVDTYYGPLQHGAFDRMLDAVRAEAWDECARQHALEFGYSVEPLLSILARNPYRKLDAEEGSEPSGKNGGERAGRVGRERIDVAPVTPSAEED